MGDYHHKHAGTFLFLLVLIFLITYLILSFYNPKWVQRKVHGRADGRNDVALTMIYAALITLGILIVLCLLYYAFYCYH